MQAQYYSLNVPDTDNTAGAPQKIEDLTDATVYIHQLAGANQAFSLNIQVKISTDNPYIDQNDDWVNFLADPLTSPQAFTLSDNGVALTLTHVRVFRNTIAAGVNPPKVVLAGRNERSE